MKYSLGERQITTHGDYWIAPGCQVIGSVVMQADSSIWFNCVVRADREIITLGEGSQVQDGCVLHADPGFPLTLGKGVSVGHMAMLHGCTIGDDSLIGIGAVVLNDAKIGKNCLVGAGSLVTEGKEFPDGSMIMGSPAKVVRELTPEQIQGIRMPAKHYIENALLFQSSLKKIV